MALNCCDKSLVSEENNSITFFLSPNAFKKLYCSKIAFCKFADNFFRLFLSAIILAFANSSDFLVNSSTCNWFSLKALNAFFSATLSFASSSNKTLCSRSDKLFFACKRLSFLIFLAVIMF